VSVSRCSGNKSAPAPSLIAAFRLEYGRVSATQQQPGCRRLRLRARTAGCQAARCTPSCTHTYIHTGIAAAWEGLEQSTLQRIMSFRLNMSLVLQTMPHTCHTCAHSHGDVTLVCSEWEPRVAVACGTDALDCHGGPGPGAARARCRGSRHWRRQPEGAGPCGAPRCTRCQAGSGHVARCQRCAGCWSHRYVCVHGCGGIDAGKRLEGRAFVA